MGGVLELTYGIPIYLFVPAGLSAAIKSDEADCLIRETLEILPLYVSFSK